jgi:S1-C subfamily serine protease
MLLAVASGREALTSARAGAVTPVDPYPAASAISAGNDASVVRVVADTCNGREAGSGVVLADGIVLTARHVVRGATSVQVDAEGLGPLIAEVLGADGTGRDIAVLRVPGLAGRPGTVVARAEVVRGTDVAASGHPRGGERRTIAGAVLGYVDAGPLAADGRRVLTVDAAFQPGMSGGPVVDAEGRLVGIAIGVERNTGTGIAVPVGTIEPTLRGAGLVPAPGCAR